MIEQGRGVSAAPLLPRPGVKTVDLLQPVKDLEGRVQHAIADLEQRFDAKLKQVEERAEVRGKIAGLTIALDVMHDLADVAQSRISAQIDDLQKQLISPAKET